MEYNQQMTDAISKNDCVSLQRQFEQVLSAARVAWMMRYFGMQSDKMEDSDTKNGSGNDRGAFEARPWYTTVNRKNPGAIA